MEAQDALRLIRLPHVVARSRRHDGADEAALYPLHQAQRREEGRLLLGADRHTAAALHGLLRRRRDPALGLPHLLPSRGLCPPVQVRRPPQSRRQQGARRGDPARQGRFGRAAVQLGGVQEDPRPRAGGGPRGEVRRRWLADVSPRAGGAHQALHAGRRAQGSRADAPVRPRPLRPHRPALRPLLPRAQVALHHALPLCRRRPDQTRHREEGPLHRDAEAQGAPAGVGPRHRRQELARHRQAL
mmetsp:Transcript_9198/g.24486  ORF Transcript_9198/g.24486 Transcript_9198/m.24486 type:complete len:243 (+) Transcript_9198:317-1045(+)